MMAAVSQENAVRTGAVARTYARFRRRTGAAADGTR